jgi:hypothetical protein
MSVSPRILTLADQGERGIKDKTFDHRYSYLYIPKGGQCQAKKERYKLLQPGEMDNILPEPLFGIGGSNSSPLGGPIILAFGASDETMQAEDIAAADVFDGHPGLPHNFDDIKVSGKTDADKKRGEDILGFFKQMAVFSTGMLDCNDLAAGTEDPKDFSAEFMRIGYSSDDIGGHDGIKTIIRKFEVAGVHDMEFHFMAILVAIQSLAGFLDHTLWNVDPHNMGVWGIQFETGAGADAYFKNFLVGTVRKIFEGFSSAGFQNLAKEKIIKRRIKRIKPFHILAIYLGFSSYFVIHL